MSLRGSRLSRSLTGQDPWDLVPKAPDRSAMSKQRPRILIVDDREENRYILTRILRDQGYECIEAGTGAEALKTAKSTPDLIILDVKLPDISGYEVCGKLKSDPATQSI